MALSESAVKAGNIVEMIRREGTLNLFVRGLEAAGLAGLLSEKGSYTVFAPVDDAVLDFSGAGFGELLNDKDRITKLISHHIVSGSFVASYFSEKTTLQTLAGEALTIDRSHFLTPDIQGSNGIVHVIDTVLVPEE